MTADRPRAVTAWLGIGSNVEPSRNIRGAVAALREHFAAVRLSPVYRSRAVGFEGEDFLNLVAAVQTTEPPAAVNARLAAIERRFGRTRGGPRFAPRTLDIDLLLYGDLVCDGPELSLPRDDVLRYGHVLRPLAELAPQLVHPRTGRTMAAHWAELAPAQPPLWRVDFAWEDAAS